MMMIMADDDYDADDVDDDDDDDGWWLWLMIMADGGGSGGDGGDDDDWFVLPEVGKAPKCWRKLEEWAAGPVVLLPVTAAAVRWSPAEDKGITRQSMIGQFAIQFKLLLLPKKSWIAIKQLWAVIFNRKHS